MLCVVGRLIDRGHRHIAVFESRGWSENHNQFATSPDLHPMCWSLRESGFGSIGRANTFRLYRMGRGGVGCEGLGWDRSRKKSQSWGAF